MKRSMYVENKGQELDGEGRIGWVETSKSGRSFYYRGRCLQKTKRGFKHNCFDTQNGDDYWVSGPRTDGCDRLYGGVVQIDEDARVAYWTEIRRQPSLVHLKAYRSGVGTRTSPSTRVLAHGARGVGRR